MKMKQKEVIEERKKEKTEVREGEVIEEQSAEVIEGEHSASSSKLFGSVERFSYNNTSNT